MHAETPTASSSHHAADRRVSRRALFGWLAAAAAGGGGLFYVTRRRDALEPWEREIVERLRHELALDAVSGEALGRAALDAIGEARPGELARRLFRTPRQFREQDAAAALDALRAQMRDDYADGRMRSVDGWQLSETEVLLFALLAAPERRRDS